GRDGRLPRVPRAGVARRLVQARAARDAGGHQDHRRHDQRSRAHRDGAARGAVRAGHHLAAPAARLFRGVTTGGSGERAIARGALRGTLVVVACAVAAYGAMVVNEATTKSYGVLSPEHVAQQALMFAVPMVGWQIFSAIAILSRLRRNRRRAFA